MRGVRQEVASPATEDRAADAAKLRLKMQPGKTQPTFRLHTCQEEHPLTRPYLYYNYIACQRIALSALHVTGLRKSQRVCERDTHPKLHKHGMHAGQQRAGLFGG